MKEWEIIADNLSKAGWSWGYVSALDVHGRTIWIVDAHGYGRRFIVRADETLAEFLALQRAIHEFAVTLSQESGKTSENGLGGVYGYTRPATPPIVTSSLPWVAHTRGKTDIKNGC
jgi:hypothetical protein